MIAPPNILHLCHRTSDAGQLTISILFVGGPGSEAKEIGRSEPERAVFNKMRCPLFFSHSQHDLAAPVPGLEPFVCLTNLI